MRGLRGWSLLVPAVTLAAGVLFATSAGTADGTDLRSGRRVRLEQLIADQNTAVREAETRAAALRREVEDATRAAAAGDRGATTEQQRVDALRRPAGLDAVRGPAVTVGMDDAPRRPDGALPAGATADDVVVHQDDVQAVVNALWAGGAEAMTIMGQRVIATSAVRCVGNTLLLHGRTYSPEFVITAVGDPDRLRDALDASDGVRAFREAADEFGLGYRVVRPPGEVTLPAYTGPVSLQHARAAAR